MPTKRQVNRALKAASEHEKSKRSSRTSREVRSAMCTIGAQSNFSHGRRLSPAQTKAACGDDAPSLAEAHVVATEHRGQSPSTKSLARAAKKKSTKKAPAKKKSTKRSTKRAPAKKRAAKKTASRAKGVIKWGPTRRDRAGGPPTARGIDKFGNTFMIRLGGRGEVELSMNNEALKPLESSAADAKDRAQHLADIAAQDDARMVKRIAARASERKKNATGLDSKTIRDAHTEVSAETRGKPTGLGVADYLRATAFDEVSDMSRFDWADLVRKDLKRLRLPVT